MVTGFSDIGRTREGPRFSITFALFMLRRSSFLECVSVLHWTCLQSAETKYIHKYVKPCLSKNPKYKLYAIKSSLTLAYYYQCICLALLSTICQSYRGSQMHGWWKQTLRKNLLQISSEFYNLMLYQDLAMYTMRTHQQNKLSTSVNVTFNYYYNLTISNKTIWRWNYKQQMKFSTKYIW
jgi:hypothetical protein